MAQFRPGQSGNPNGRPKGSANKANKEMRQAIQQIIEGNLDKVQGWIDAVAKDDPNQALSQYIKLLDFVLPKLSRQENVADLEPFEFRIEDVIRVRES